MESSDKKLKEEPEIEEKIRALRARLRRRARIIIFIGLTLYLGTSFLLEIFFPAVADKWTVRLFTAMIIFWGVHAMWPPMNGGFELGLENYRTMTPAMRDLSQVARDLNTTIKNHSRNGDLLQGVFEEVKMEIKGLRQDFRKNMNFNFTPPDPSEFPDELLDEIPEVVPTNGTAVDPNAETRTLPAVESSSPADVCSSTFPDIPLGT